MQDPTPSRTRTPFPLRQAARDGDVALVLGWAQAVGTKWGTCPPIPEEYLLELWRRLIRAVIAVLDESVPMMFSAQPPKDEPDFNQKVGAVLRTHIPQLQSEHPLASFACAGYTPDHVIQGNHLEIESKYIRTNTSPAKASLKFPPRKRRNSEIGW